MSDAPADDGTTAPAAAESAAIAERYARRARPDRYSALRPDVWQTLHERQRAMLALFARRGWYDLSDLRVLEVGCGSGGNLLELLRLGCQPRHLTGVELLPERCAQARAVLPSTVRLIEADATRLELPAASHDIVMVSTVFSSLLDPAFQQALAEAIWRWVAPGGGVLWYDFVVDNPRNRDVRGVPMARVRALFPQAVVEVRRVTLAPPLARAVTRLHPSLYGVFNALPLLRTHRLAWLAKPARDA